MRRPVWSLIMHQHPTVSPPQPEQLLVRAQDLDRVTAPAEPARLAVVGHEAREHLPRSVMMTGSPVSATRSMSSRQVAFSSTALTFMGLP